MMFSLRQTFTLSLALCCLAIPFKNEALYTSVKSSGMGGAVAAHPLDSLVAAYNPGGLGFVGDRWDLGVHFGVENGKTKFSDNDTVSGTFDSHHGNGPIVVPEFGINAYTTDSLFTWGFVLYNRDFFKTHYSQPNALYGTSKLGLEYWHAVAGPTASVIICEDHCIGLSVDFHGQRLKVNGLENFATDVFSIHPHKVTNKGYDYSGGVGATLGWVSKISNCLTIGGAFAPRVQMSRLNKYKGLIAEKGRIDIPQRAVGGVAIHPIRELTVALDIEHCGYNRIHSLGHSIHLAEARLGKKEGSGLGWMDQTVFRLGVDWEPSKYCSLRCGYIYQRAPVRSSQTFANALIPNVYNRIVTMGGTWNYDCNEFSFYSAYAFRERKKGSSTSIPEILGGGSVDLREDKWIVGFSWARFF